MTGGVGTAAPPTAGSGRWRSPRPSPWGDIAGTACPQARHGSAAPLTGSGAPTGSERRIAELAADGRTNTEIADLLHLARRTVETHLTSAYRKLGIRRRTQLRTVLTTEPEG